MSAVASWVRIDIRRRWRSLLVLVLLIAVAAGTVMTAVAGARRGASAIDRLVEQTLPATAVVLPNQPGFDWDAVRALPQVEALTTFVVTGYVVDGVPPEHQAFVGHFPPADDEIMRTIERPVVLEGRLADPTRPDEVVVSAKFEDSFGLGVGDTVTIELAAPEQVDQYFEDDIEPTWGEGPAIEATIVGVIRSGWFSEETVNDLGFIVPSPGLHAEYAPNLLGSELSSASINALVRLNGGESALPEFKAALAGVTGNSGIDVWNWFDKARHVENVTRFEANSLLAFAAAAGIAAVFLLGQSIARYAASTVADLQVMRAVGMTPDQSRLVAVIGPTLAAGAGAVVGTAGAVVASQWFPIGTAALAEPSPGMDVDPAVLVTGVVATPLLVALAAVGAAWFAVRSTLRTAPSHRSAVAAAAARVGAPVPAIVGARFALEAGQGRSAVPVRPAILGAVAGVLGVLAAMTFSSGINDAATNLERFGQTYQLQGFLGYNSRDFAAVDTLLPALADDPDVVAVNDTRQDIAQAGDVAVAVATFRPVGNPLDVVLTGGRMPERAGEIVLAPRTADSIGAAVGDTIRLTGTRGDSEATVAGTGFVPAAPHNDYATGAWVTPETYDALFDGFKFHLGLVALRSGADPAAVIARAAESAGLTLEPVAPPVELAELQQVRELPVYLAGFLALLALGAVGHALATAVRRRRHDLAVLRALGMTRWQSRGVVVTQASVLALVGLAAGVPLGVALGRTVWRYVANTTPVFYVPPVAWLALVLVVPVALVAANLLAAWPGHRAASMRVGHVLRAE
ncbi:FtsX-like permease family protein [Phytoactinopolyspora alkaliphila]|uniref:FtsX-like permease family protein n=1 Tax=Phytoactinopolyspora alkaliphila TaxID=1783498 RepID=A0A6N9YHK4_9ACTN|nr:FtsX-like permease family protein [Phytoactinopolyspora alkaliphila]NED94415.1 FtsX-like permease family protein [Phytoactinopolyspora alkaliphila]